MLKKFTQWSKQGLFTFSNSTNQALLWRGDSQSAFRQATSSSKSSSPCWLFRIPEWRFPDNDWALFRSVSKEWMFIEHLRTGRPAENLIPMAFLNPYSPPTWEVLLFPSFTDEETSPKQSNLTCPRWKESSQMGCGISSLVCRKHETTSQTSALAWCWESGWVPSAMGELTFFLFCERNFVVQAIKSFYAFYKLGFFLKKIFF